MFAALETCIAKDRFKEDVVSFYEKERGKAILDTMKDKQVVVESMAFGQGKKGSSYQGGSHPMIPEMTELADII